MGAGRHRVVTSRAKGPDLGDLAGPVLLALLGGDEAAVEELVSSARSRGADTALVLRDLAMPALCEVGRMWARGEVSIAEEHLATALAWRVLARTSGNPDASAAPRRRVVFACLAGEFHDLGVCLLASVARECGWDAESLGANVPREALVRFVAERPPAALALSVALAGHVPEAALAIAEVRAVAPGITVLVGGFAFREDSDRAALTGADVSISDAVALREWLRGQKASACPPAPNGLATCRLPASMPTALRRKVARSR